MSGHRRSSTTSLSQFARRKRSSTNSGSASKSDHGHHDDLSFDFCNAFWGPDDGGVDVLLTRMRGAEKTVQELRAFYKERALIEEDYARRLAKLAKMSVGRDEIGELRDTLDTLRLETDKQAIYHAQLSQKFRRELEAQTVSFHTQQAHFRKTHQTGVEKLFKTKQSQDNQVSKAREKYESDCQRVNVYTAETKLCQGRDLEKVQLRLERERHSAEVNEADFEDYSKRLQRTARKWEVDWRAYCDMCQDLEEDRMEFMKDSVWAYVNAISTTCVDDDESCERLRLALEAFEPRRDMETFVRDYGTGSTIPDPPRFIDYSDPDAMTKASCRPVSHRARFSRMSSRREKSRSSTSGSGSTRTSTMTMTETEEGSSIEATGWVLLVPPST